MYLIILKHTGESLLNRVNHFQKRTHNHRKYIISRYEFVQLVFFW